MMRLAATAIAVVLLRASPAFAGGVVEDLVKDLPSVELVKSSDDGSHRNIRPSLSSSQIAAVQYHEAAVQYHEPLSFRCQTRAGIFNVYPLRPTDTTCVVNGLPGFMLP